MYCCIVTGGSNACTFGWETCASASSRGLFNGFAVFRECSGGSCGAFEP
jgi:hypothetical protein